MHFCVCVFALSGRHSPTAAAATSSLCRIIISFWGYRPTKVIMSLNSDFLRCSIQAASSSEFTLIDDIKEMFYRNTNVYSL